MSLDPSTGASPAEAPYQLSPREIAFLKKNFEPSKEPEWIGKEDVIAGWPMKDPVRDLCREGKHGGHVLDRRTWRKIRAQAKRSGLPFRCPFSRHLISDEFVKQELLKESLHDRAFKFVVQSPEFLRRKLARLVKKIEQQEKERERQEALLEQELARNRAQLDQELARNRAQLDQELARNRAQLDQELARMQALHEEKSAQQRAIREEMIAQMARRAAACRERMDRYREEEALRDARRKKEEIKIKEQELKQKREFELLIREVNERAQQSHESSMEIAALLAKKSWLEHLSDGAAACGRAATQFFRGIGQLFICFFFMVTTSFKKLFRS